LHFTKIQISVKASKGEERLKKMWRYIAAEINVLLLYGLKLLDENGDIFMGDYEWADERTRTQMNG
jgi:hypothetical protein